MHFRSSVLLLTLAVAACGYSAPDEVINGQAVAAVQKNNTAWSSYTTFTIADKIRVFNNQDGSSDQYTQDAPQVIAQVRKNMVARGYTEIPFTAGLDTADLVIGLTAYLGSSTYGGYYCDWYYWGYYPYGCGYYYYGTYNFGTLQIQMADFKNGPHLPPGSPPPTTGPANLQIVWDVAMYGLLGTQSYNLQIVQNSIDRAFAQSPYIQK